jgi:nucleotidyltransferase substrate binding protein (TIGR01987 family)
MQLDITSLQEAVNRLNEGIEKFKEDPQDEFVRDACIQRFEYTYELCHKTLRRYLEMYEPSDEAIKTMSFPTLIRTGCERDLLRSDWRKWQIYRDARNNTSHTYDELIAKEMMEIVPDFLLEAKALFNNLKQRI